MHAGRSFIGALVALALAVPAPAAEVGEAVGRVARLEGDALVTRAGAATTDLLRAEAPIYPQDRIETLAGSRIELRFADDTVVFLGPRSTLRVTEFVYAPARERRLAVLELIAGVFRAVVGRLLPDSAFELRAQDVVAAVRGTDWMAERGDELTSIVVLEGALAVARTVDGREALVLREGEGVDVRMGEPLRKKRWGQGRIDAMRERMLRHRPSHGMRSERMEPGMRSERAESR